MSFGLSHLNTVERRKIRSGSSAAIAGVANSAVKPSSAINAPLKLLDARDLKNVMQVSVSDAFYLGIPT